MTTSTHDMFEFWEADLADAHPALGAARDLDALSLALELQNAEWSEAEAGAELASRFGVAELRTAQVTVIAALQISPVVLVRGIGASRALWIALDIAGA